MSEKKRTRAIDPNKILCRTIDSQNDNNTYYPFHLKPENLDMQTDADAIRSTYVKCAICGKLEKRSSMTTALDVCADVEVTHPSNRDPLSKYCELDVCKSCYQAGFDRRCDYRGLVFMAKEFRDEHSEFRGGWTRLQGLLFELPKTCVARVARYNERYTALEPVGTFDNKNWYKLDSKLRNAEVLRIDVSVTEPNPDEFQHGVLEVLIE